jgi:alkanesulfonate monooxygenase SsuD/methylene tetrahydromethanopterin reductase-like flavin-dependent oxidoreductase (luciferase family)
LPLTLPQFRNPPGYISVDDNVRLMKASGRPPNRSFTKDGRAINMMTGSVQDLIDAGILFCGTPDQVYAQIVDFAESCGGLGNFLSMSHAGFMSHEDTVANLTLFAKEVLPRLQEYRQPSARAAAE